LQMDMGGRAHSKKSGLNQRQRRRKKRYHDPKYYENDSDFDSAEENEDEQKKNNNSNNNSNGKKSYNFGINQRAMQQQQKSSTSALTSMISSMSPQAAAAANGDARRGQQGRPALNGRRSQYGDLEMNGAKFGRYEPEIEQQGANGAFHTFHLTVYFGEWIHEEPIKLEVTGRWTVAETMDRAIQKWNVERALNKLRGVDSAQYIMRCMDEDEIDSDVPAFVREAQIHTINEKVVGMQYVGGNPMSASRATSNSVGYESGPSSYPADNGGNGNKGGIMSFKSTKEQVLIRVTIPGPNNESHVLAIDKDATALTLRDLITLLNKKKLGAHFHAQYFNIYLDGHTKLKEALPLSKNMTDLEENRQLVLLPRFLAPNEDINEAYNFHLVRLANEQRDYRCQKVRNARKNKKRLLTVDRHRITKKAMDDYNIGANDHVPIDISTIQDLHVNDKNNKQFTIEYRKQGHTQTTVQVYELDSVKDCQDFVHKVKFLSTIRKLQAI